MRCCIYQSEIGAKRVLREMLGISTDSDIGRIHCQLCRILTAEAAFVSLF